MNKVGIYLNSRLLTLESNCECHLITLALGIELTTALQLLSGISCE